MAPRRHKHPFWRQNDPAAKFDIAKLRPKPLPRADRFETLNDVRRKVLAAKNYSTPIGVTMVSASFLKSAVEAIITVRNLSARNAPVPFAAGS